MIRPHITKGTRVRLVCPTNALEGIEPDPLPPGSEGSVEYLDGNFATVRWDAGYTLTHVWDDLKQIKKENKP